MTFSFSVCVFTTNAILSSGLSKRHAFTHVYREFFANVPPSFVSRILLDARIKNSGHTPVPRYHIGKRSRHLLFAFHPFDVPLRPQFDIEQRPKYERVRNQSTRVYTTLILIIRAGLRMCLLRTYRNSCVNVEIISVSGAI